MANQPLRILHVFRAPVGGLFRHVVDLARGQIARGHEVGIIADSTTGGDRAERILGDISPHLALGLSRHPMSRQPAPSDYFAIRHVSRRVRETRPHVLHGHGAKGAAYARVAHSNCDPIRVYTPHGGSLHYRPGSLAGRFYASLEKLMLPLNDLFLFESGFGARLYRETIGAPRGLVRIVHNGVSASEFEPVAPAPEASDLVFIGELRALKGIDILLKAMGALHAQGLPLSAVVVGDGPDRSTLAALAQELNLKDHVHFAGPLPAREAFAKGRIMVVPSRAESLPYVVLEAGAAGVPLIATNVGGIPEIFGPDLSGRLIAPGNVEALNAALLAVLNDMKGARDAATLLQDRIRSEFSVEAMVEGVIDAYREAIARPRSKFRNNPLLKLFR